MCDTMVATASVTRDGVTLFAKNSDREPNEAHHLLTVPAADHAAGSEVRCTYISIPQVAHTYATLLAKPYWIWGAEMGVNEHGVAIGNEAIFSRLPASRKPELIGMDLLRLALERAETARQAVTIITDLIEQYGQGGNCGFRHKFFYHNSFLIADPKQAWLLETVDRHWAARQIQGSWVISNGLSIGNEWDIASSDLVRFAISRSWCADEKSFHFARCYSDRVYTTLSDCRRRAQHAWAHLAENAGQVTIETVLAVLRDNHTRGDTGREPAQGLIGASVCMHAGFGPVRASQTTGSMIAVLHPDRPTIFATGSAAPCTSVFKPLWLDAGPRDLETLPGADFDLQSLFWRHERLHRSTLLDYSHRIAAYARERDALESTFIHDALTALDQGPAVRAGISATAFAESVAAEDEWLARIKQMPISSLRPPLYAIAWNKFNRQAKMPAF